MQDVLALVGFVAAVYLVGQAAELLRCPGLLGELLAGVILGPHGLQLLSADMAGSLKTAGELGLLLMVMDGGLAMELPVLRKQGGRATVLALTGTALPVLLGWATMVALGTGGLAAVAAGTALSSTAIGFTLRMMSDLQLLETPQGQLITAAAMLDDVFSLVLLAMLRALQPAEDGQLRIEAWPLIRPLVASLGVLVAAVACAALTRRIDAMLRAPPQRAPPDAPPDAPPEAPPGGRWQQWREMLLAPAATVAAMVALGVLLAGAAEAVGSSALLGAFVAGTSFCFLPHARVAWAGAAAAPQAWLSRLFFGATVAFEVPLASLVGASAVGDGLAMTAAAILGKFLSGAWAVPLVTSEGCAGRPFWGG